MIKNIISIYLFSALTVSAPAQTKTSTPINDIDKKITETNIWNLKAGDSIVIYESRIISSDVAGPVSDNGMAVPLNSLFASHPDTKFYSRTSKYVIKKDSGFYKLSCYVSDKSRYPNFGFDRVMKKDDKWHFKKYAEKKLSDENVKDLCLFEIEAMKAEINKYDEGDVSKSITVIKHGSKVICSSYITAYRVDKVNGMK